MAIWTISWIKTSIMLGLSLFMVMISGVTPATASSEMPEQGAHLFEVHCVGCHPGGGNIIRRGKTLKTRALTRYGYDNQSAVVGIITNGKGVMSAYRERLTTAEIETLAAYVLDQAESGWPS
jgi:cytochrome c6